jgi:hypothetical protein
VDEGEEDEMTARSKLIALELAGGLFGWLWIIARFVAIVCLIGALFGGWLWSRFFWALGISVVSKWLLRGFHGEQAAHRAGDASPRRVASRTTTA